MWVGEEKYLWSDQLKIRDVNWFVPRISKQLKVNIRYQHKGALADITTDSHGALIKFEAPQRAVTPGQAAVFYDGAHLVGGGWIV